VGDGRQQDDEHVEQEDKHGVHKLHQAGPIFMPSRESAIPAACNASAARRHVVTALLPATVTPGHSSAEAQGAISPNICCRCHVGRLRADMHIVRFCTYGGQLRRPSSRQTSAACRLGGLTGRVGTPGPVTRRVRGRPR
jgi:hypothetical protein